jgi:hypothetical protein
MTFNQRLKFFLLFQSIFILSSIYLYINSYTHALLVFVLIVLIYSALFLFLTSYFDKISNAWIAFGNILHKILSPIIAGIVFYILITPLAIVLRLFGRDILKLKINHRSTNWSDCENSVIDINDFRNLY